MIPISSNLENRDFSLHALEETLKPIGFSIGGNWDYDQGSFDYKMGVEDGYQFLRIPFTAVKGMLDSPGVIVKLGKPFVLSHVYQSGIDEDGRNGALRGAVDQFQAPVDADAQVADKFIHEGRQLLQKVEQLLMER
ncbi:YugN-like family protein [Sediminibacillus albus]|uniref:YugN-like family protein n=1 Tax=Sediminibacillus albus TaxID=407036 RepID=A0A1G8Z088_9BACI|nr:YugN-like family protein [Sediminibacillus albus]SDK08397.1 YugN-like family protein [Sediminibacillus albus]